ncbi:MAG: DNA-binding transcriptional regulator [Pseudomonadota bacterium]
MPSFANIRSAERTFDILRAMNSQNISRVRDLQEKTELPPATVVRVLETLVSLGYVQCHGRRVGYTLTEKILELSAGYHGLPLFIENAKDALLELTETIRWPAALATLDGTAMVVRISTIPNSPLAHTHSTLQKRLELLVRAHGRAYLAFCSREERRNLYWQLHKQEITTLPPDELEERMQGILANIKALGYAERAHEIDPHTTTLAMPIVVAERVRATVGVTFFRGANANRNSILREMKNVAERLQSMHVDDIV